MSRPRVSLLRRLGAVLYDFMLIGFTVGLIGAIVATALGHFLNLPNAEIPPHSLLAKGLFVLQIALAFLLVAWFWTRDGQTLGMKAWKIRVQNRHGQRLTWPQAAMRFSVALLSFAALGVGFWVALWDADGLTWHDRYSQTYLVLV